jgi:hypothetical protein
MGGGQLPLHFQPSIMNKPDLPLYNMTARSNTVNIYLELAPETITVLV